MVDPADFVGEINIPGSDEKPVQEQLAVFAAKYEPMFYKILLGYALYAEYVAAPNTEKWVAMDDLLYDCRLYYIYYWFIRKQRSYQGRQGTSKAKVENADVVSPGENMVFVWNTMVDMIWEIVKNWNTELYGDYYLKSYQRRPDIFHKQNTFNI